MRVQVYAILWTMNRPHCDYVFYWALLWLYHGHNIRKFKDEVKTNANARTRWRRNIVFCSGTNAFAHSHFSQLQFSPLCVRYRWDWMKNRMELKGNTLANDLCWKETSLCIINDETCVFIHCSSELRAREYVCVLVHLHKRMNNETKWTGSLSLSLSLSLSAYLVVHVSACL